MAIKRNSDSADNDNSAQDSPGKSGQAEKPAKAPSKKASAGSTEEKVEAVARKARKTAIKVAAAVSDTVKEIAEKVGRKASGTAKAPRAKAAAASSSAASAPKASSVTRKKSSTGAMGADVSSKDVNAGILDSTSSISIKAEDEIKDEAATDVKQHFFHDQHVHAGPPPPQAPRDLPDEYGDTKLVLLVRDPEWAYAYWELNDDTRAAHGLPREGHDKRISLRLFKITHRQWPTEPAHYFFDVDVDSNAKSWYLRLPEPNEQWCAELGFVDDQQDFISIVRSNPIITPRNTISDHVDAEWMTVEESFEKITRVSGGGNLLEAQLRGDVGAASESILRQINKQLTGILHGERPTLSSGIFSSESALPVAANKQFWLQVNTELILFGATEPDAVVTVQGKVIPLNPDGTFSLRFALPDGEQVLQVKAVNADGDMDETITPIVNRTTI